MNRHRYRINFRKESDLRWISHRDLLRLLERALRRANLHLSMTEGFHPKPRFSFPLALALGLEGHAEWMEIELRDDLPADAVRPRLQAELPDGLVLSDCQRLPPGEPKLIVDRALYQVTIPRHDCPRVQETIDRIGRGESLVGSASPDQAPRDLGQGFLDLSLHDDQLTIEQRPGQTGGIGPRQILAALGLPDLEREGHVIARIAILLTNATKHQTDERVAPPLGNEHPTVRRPSFS